MQGLDKGIQARYAAMAEACNNMAMCSESLSADYLTPWHFIRDASSIFQALIAVSLSTLASKYKRPIFTLIKVSQERADDLWRYSSPSKGCSENARSLAL